MKLSIIAAVLFLLIATTVDANKIRRRNIRRRAKAGKSCKNDKSAGTLTATIWSYPGTTNPVSGDVRVVIDENGLLTLDAALKNVPNDCDETAKCGIHIHSGVTCANADLVEGHYWNGEEGFADQWFADDGAYYVSGDGGDTASASFTITNGYGFDCNANHAVVVHASSADKGARIGCGVLSAGKSCKKLKATVAAYPGYTGGEEVTGEVKVDFGDDDSVDLTMTANNLAGASTLCDNSDGKSKCGIHIHAGITCDDAALVGGHYWDKFATTPVVPDPWFAKDPYNAVYDANGDVDFEVTNGYDCSNNVGHALVIHKQGTGARVGCGILKEA